MKKAIKSKNQRPVFHKLSVLGLRSPALIHPVMAIPVRGWKRVSFLCDPHKTKEPLCSCAAALLSSACHVSDCLLRFRSALNRVKELLPPPAAGCSGKIVVRSALSALSSWSQFFGWLWLSLICGCCAHVPQLLTLHPALDFFAWYHCQIIMISFLTQFPPVFSPSFSPMTILLCISWQLRYASAPAVPALDTQVTSTITHSFLHGNVSSAAAHDGDAADEEVVQPRLNKHSSRALGIRSSMISKPTRKVLNGLKRKGYVTFKNLIFLFLLLLLWLFIEFAGCSLTL